MNANEDFFEAEKAKAKLDMKTNENGEQNDSNSDDKKSHVGRTQMQGHQVQMAEDALSYCNKVKIMFINQPEVYDDFVDILEKFASRSIDTPDCIKKLSILFRDHPELIVELNSFLSPDERVEVQPNEQVCGSENSALESDFQALALETVNPLA